MSRDMLVQAFERIVRAQGSEPLVLSPSRASTAADIDALARAVAATLRRAGLEPGSLVGLVAPNGPAFLASLLALRHADCPALLFDWRTPAAELERIGRALGATAVLRFATAWPAGAAEASLAAIERDEAAGTSVPGPGAFDSAAIVQLTSGSTGEPQGILKTMESVMIDDRALAASMSLSRDERILAAIPMSHAYGLSSVAMPALTRGCCLVVPDEGNPLGTMHAAQVGDVTFLPTVPAYLQALLRMTAPPPLPASLRLVITAGAPLHPETAARFRQTYDRPVHVFYGASEVGGICFDRAGDAAERGTLGTPVEGVQITLAEAPGADEPGAGGGEVDLAQSGVEFAQAGIWYDALEALSDDVDAHPGDRKARFLRSALLRQVNLDAAVE